jgi:hypothetical protein
MECQDWETVKIRSNTKKVVIPPLRVAGSKAMRALETDDIPKITKTLRPESRADIIRIRTTMEPKRTQAELNTACAFPPNTIRDIESGKICPSPTQLNVLNRVLRTSLRFVEK